MSESSNIKKIVTHNGSFHADDIFACATISLFLENLGQKYEIFRTRDIETILRADYVFDVGGVYDPKINRFDHHQIGGSGKRKNGIPYAAFGLSWKHFGIELCEFNQRAWEKIDLKIASPIDAIDNGVDFTKGLYKNVGPDTLSEIFLIYSPTWKEDDSQIDQIFLEQVLKAKDFLKREIKVVLDDTEGEDIILNSYKKSKDKRVVKLHTSLPRYLYQSILSDLKEPLYVVYPSSHTKDFVVEAIRKNRNTMLSRKPLPKNWRGFMNGFTKEAKKITGIDGIVFTHQNGFLAHLESEKKAIKFVKKLLEI